MEYFLPILVFLTGLCVGSFINVCIYRMPRSESVVLPPSHCPYCCSTLHFADLVPVASYLSLKGKCRYCGSGISPQYPVVELFCGILFLLAFLKYGFTLATLRAFLLFSVALCATVIDIKYGIIPDRLNLAGVILGIPLVVEAKAIFLSGAAGFLAGGGLLFIIALASRGGMGGGDIKLAAVLGLLLGWKELLVALFLAFFTGGVAGVGMLALTRARLKDPLPFGPYLALGAVAAALAGDKIIAWYQTVSGI